MEKSRLGVHLMVVLGLMGFVLSGCSMMKELDSCDLEVRCELNPGINQSAVRLSGGESKKVTICACRPWNDSGIAVLAGQSYAFNIVSTTHWVDGWVESDPIDGWQGIGYKAIGFLSGWLKRSDKAPWYALVGSVGMDDNHAFAVVESKDGSVTMDRSGVLYFFANDMDGRYFNNKGEVILEVVLIK